MDKYYISLENFKTFLHKLQEKYKANSDWFGGIKIGFVGDEDNQPVQLDGEGRAYVHVTKPEKYQLPIATQDVLGGIMAPNSTSALNINDKGALTVNVDNKTISVNNENNLQLGQDKKLTESLNNSTYTQSGIYNIIGQKTQFYNLPIDIDSQFQAKLIVDSNNLEGVDKKVTQILIYTIADGCDGNIYIRHTIKPKSNETITLEWSDWVKLTHEIQLSKTLNGDFEDEVLSNNGTYVWSKGSQSFKLITMGGQNTKAQFLFSSWDGSKQNKPGLKKRTLTYSETEGKWEYGTWEDISNLEGYKLEPATSEGLGGVKIGLGFEYNEETGKLDISHTELNNLYQYICYSTPETKSENWTLNPANNRYECSLKYTETPAVLAPSKCIFSKPNLDDNQDCACTITLSPLKYTIIENCLEDIDKGFSKVDIESISIISLSEASKYLEKDRKNISEFGFLFKASDSGCTLETPGTIKWANGLTPVILPNDTIEIRFTFFSATNILASWTKYI